MSGREVVGYVVREGKVRGEGRYHGFNDNKSETTCHRHSAHVWWTRYTSSRRDADYFAGDTCRVVRLVKRAPATADEQSRDETAIELLRERDAAREKLAMREYLRAKIDVRNILLDALKALERA